MMSSLASTTQVKTPNFKKHNPWKWGGNILIGIGIASIGCSGLSWFLYAKAPFPKVARILHAYPLVSQRVCVISLSLGSPVLILGIVLLLYSDKKLLIGIGIACMSCSAITWFLYAKAPFPKVARVLHAYPWLTHSVCATSSALGTLLLIYGIFSEVYFFDVAAYSQLALHEMMFPKEKVQQPSIQTKTPEYAAETQHYIEEIALPQAIELLKKLPLALPKGYEKYVVLTPREGKGKHFNNGSSLLVDYFDISPINIPSSDGSSSTTRGISMLPFYYQYREFTSKSFGPQEKELKKELLSQFSQMEEEESKTSLYLWYQQENGNYTTEAYSLLQ